MPTIDHNVWKVGYEFYWFRQYQDGRTEYLFDPETGMPSQWGSGNERLTKVGWLPMTPDLANKIQPYHETGYPVNGSPVWVELKPGEEPICYRECSLTDGFHITCNVCQGQFLEPDLLSECPDCGSKKTLLESGRTVDPLVVQGATWENATYVLGVKDKFQVSIDSEGVVVQSGLEQG